MLTAMAAMPEPLALAGAGERTQSQCAPGVWEWPGPAGTCPVTVPAAVLGDMPQVSEHHQP